MSPARVPIVLDTDGGIDDAVALWWALTDPRVDLRAVVVTWGNVTLATAFAVVAKVLTAAGRPEVPVVLGAGGPVGPTPLPEPSTAVHGDDGLGGHGAGWPTGGVEPVDVPVPDLLGEGVTLVTIGPLSTLALALRADPAIPARVRGLIVMGGAVAVPGNALPAAEANIAHDPVAAAEVVAAGWAAAPLLVGLDVTREALAGPRHLDLAERSGTPAARMLAPALRFYADVSDRAGFTAPGTCAVHDLLAVVAAVDPAVITDAPTLPLAVDTGGSACWATTLADRRPEALRGGTPTGFRPWRVALGVDVPRFDAELCRVLCIAAPR